MSFKENVRTRQVFLGILAAGWWSCCGGVPQQHAATPLTSTAKTIWAQARVGGQPAGFYSESSEIGADNHILTSIENDIVLNRLGTKVEIKSTSHYDESPDGRLLGVKNDMSSSAQTTQMEAVVKDSSLVIRTSTGGKTYERTVSFTGTLLGPEGIRRLTLSHLKSPNDAISYQMFYPEVGSVITGTNTLAGRDLITIGDKRWSSLKLEETISAMPGKATLWVDNTGWMLREVQTTPFGDIETTRTDAETARGSAGTGASLPDEVFSRTVVRSNIRLPEERLIENLKVRITQKDPELGWPDLDADNQKLLERASDHVVLEISRPVLRQDGKRPVPSTPALAPFLAPNALLQSDDATVQSIASNVVGNDSDLFRSARALQKWTNDNMHFDLGIAIVTASEVARDRRGTCLGYSVLLASLARAAGIPSRIRMGFVYAGGVWGGHAWVEVLVGNDWIPLDGALYSPGVADAARFSFMTSALEEGTLTQIGSLAKLYGHVDIQILEYTVDGKRVTVPNDAKPFVVEGDVYRNPWIGLTVVKPKSFQFAKLDATWPDSTLVAMEGPLNQRVEIESRSESLPTSETPDAVTYLSSAGVTGSRSIQAIAGHPAVVVSSGDKAGALLVNGGGVWLIKATGPDALHLLTQVASTIRLRGRP